MTPEEIKNYFLVKRGGVCRSLVVYPNKRVEEYPGEACHRFLGELDPGCTQIYSSLWFRSADKTKTLAKRYWAYILGPQSPWRDLKPSVVRNDEGYPIAFCMDINADTSSQMVANLCMASRVPYEHPQNLRLWGYLVTNGYDGAEALLVITFVKKWGRELEYHNSGSWHFPLDTAYTPKLADLRAGKPPEVDGRKIQKGQDYIYSHTIWGETKGAMHPIKKALSNDKPYTGVFMKRFKHQHNAKGLLKDNGVITNLREAMAALEATRHEW